MYYVDNAVIMAAGTSSRFAPLSFEKPKALIEVKGEVLIERQIRQLKEAGISEIIVVTGYRAEMFAYLKDAFQVQLVYNPEYQNKNNHASIYAIKDYLKNTYICSADNYFFNNPFEKEVDESYYAAAYASGETKEWCITCDDQDRIIDVNVGGRDSWYMFGHAFLSKEFSKAFIGYLEEEYEYPETAGLFWEDIYIHHIDQLLMKIRRYSENTIFEFDTLDELRRFDSSYINQTRSAIILRIADKLGCGESEIKEILPVKNSLNEVIGFTFFVDKRRYQYSYESGDFQEV